MKNSISRNIIRSGLGLLASLIPVLGTDAVYQNDGTITAADTPPQVDALQFINNGSMTMSIISSPFETRNTTSFINRGIIRASPGVRFEKITHQSVRTPADSFIATAGSRLEVSSSQALAGFNFTPAQLLALDQLGIDLTTLLIPTDQNPFQDYQSATMTISAKTIDIRGRLQTDVGSSIELTGTDVRLINASVYGSPPPGSSSRQVDTQPDGTIDYVIAPIGLTPSYGLGLDVGVTYEGLASATKDIQVLQTLSGPVINLVDTATALTPAFRYRDRGTQLRAAPDDRLPRQSIDLSTSRAHSYYIVTNAPTPTNQTVRASFVGASDPDVLVDLIYGAGGSIRLLLGTTITNVADGGVDLIALSVDSSFPTDPRLGFVPTDKSALDVWPLEMSVRRYAAQSIAISRKDAVTGNVTNILSRANLLSVMRTLTRSGRPSTNAPFRPDLFTKVYLPTNLSLTPVAFTNLAATNPFVAFGFEFKSTPSDTELIDTPSKSFLTNNTGRVSISSKTLDLTRTRIKSQGPVVIETDDLVATTGSAIEAPYVSLNLGNTSTNGLVIEGLIRPLFETLSGSVDFFSSTWTNNATFPDPTSTNTPPTDLTAEVGFQYTVANVNVTRTQLTRINDLVVRSSKVTVNDSGTIENLAASDTAELNINGQIAFQNTLVASGANLASLKRLNIGSGGSLQVPSLVSLGTAGNRLDSVSVLGTLQAAGIRLDSKTITVGSAASLRTVRGTLDLTADTLTVSDSGTATAGIRGSGPSAITVGNLNLIRGSIGGTNSALRLSVTGAFNAPAASGGIISVPNGLEFNTRPASADLSGLTIRSEVAPYADAAFVWPGTDLGAVVAGFIGPSNLAIKALALGGDNYSTISFSGPDAKNALYVQQIQFLPGAIPVVTNITISTNLSGVKLTNTVITPNLGFVKELMQIPSSFTVYFGSAITDGGVDISDALDRVIPERLRLVKLPKTPPTVVKVTLDNGDILSVPISVVESLSLDSDGDGVANGWDAKPFEGIRLAVESTEAGGEQLVKLSFMAGAGGSYRVEASSGLGSWGVVQTVQNPSSDRKLIELYDRSGTAGAARNYRVRYSY